jgi:hypothetical protein
MFAIRKDMGIRICEYCSTKISPYMYYKHLRMCTNKSYIDTLKTKINELEEENKSLQFTIRELQHKNGLKRQKRIQYEKGPCVYIITHPREIGWKVGRASDLTSRVSTLNTGSSIPYKVEFVWYTTFANEAEETIHFKLREYRVTPNREWFNPPLLEVILTCFEETRVFLENN